VNSCGRRPARATFVWGGLACAVLAGFLAFACGGADGASARSAERPVPAGKPVHFAYRTTEGETFGARTTRGRATAVLFVTTYDLASQVEARRLEQLVHRQRPRINAGAVVLETEQYEVLADAFRTSLGLSYPVCLADQATREKEGPFGNLSRVPTLVVLDRDGVEVWRKEGLASTSEMKQALTTASRRGSPTAQ